MIFDCEGNSLTPTKFHVLSYFNEETDNVVSLTTHEDMRKWLLEQEILIGHNIILWDVPQLERVLNIKIKAQLIDTLALSWYLYDERNRHGLEEWGEEFGIPKVKIDDWENLPLEEYIERCEQDVRINSKLYTNIYEYLTTLYDVFHIQDLANLPIVKYLSFKLDCAREQERSRWKIDLDKVYFNLAKLEKIKLEKEEAIKKIMPPVEKYSTHNPPAKPYKKDGSLSVTGVRWQKYLSDLGLTKDHSLPISIFSHYEQPNPNSHIQIKDWLFSLGWEPQTFKYEREEDGTMRAIPQIKKLMEPEFCDSVRELYVIEPGLEELEGLSIINHRIGCLNALLECHEDGWVKAQISGLTNTLRFKHSKPCVNLPGIDKLYGKEVRECFIADDGYELVGSDMVSLEDMTKRHYIYPFDPDFVESMSREGFDPHLDLAVHAGVLTEQQVENHVKGVENHGKIRKDYKKVNYSGTYGIGADKLARELKTTRVKAAKLLKDFWARNWSIKAVADVQKVKIVNGQKWIFNPVSQFWYTLRAEKDRFSTLNQSTGVYCFDRWIATFRSIRPQLTAQFHDEVVLQIKEGYFEEAKKLLERSIDKVNEELKLNIVLSIDVKHGNNYSEIH